MIALNIWLFNSVRSLGYVAQKDDPNNVPNTTYKTTSN